MKPNIGDLRKSNSWTMVLGESSSTNSMVMPMSDNKDKLRRGSPRFSLGQAMALAAICASTAAVLTAVEFISLVSNSTDYYADRLLPSSSRSMISRTRVRLVDGNTAQQGDPSTFSSFSYRSGDEHKGLAASTAGFLDGKFPFSVLPSFNMDDPRPHIAWLMSFPNSGTSFTLHMTREASNCTTATNYALEGDIKDKPSVPAIEGPLGENGPFLELIPDRATKIPDTILTKTHCKGFCSGAVCGPDETLHTVRSFMVGCLSGKKAIINEQGKLEKIDVTYDRSLVKKAIHIFRHPLDNIVARFHLELKVQGERGNKQFASDYPRNATGFRKWCEDDDLNRELLVHRFIDAELRDKMRDIPCRNEFYRYVSWHNSAFAVSRELNIPTMLLHYEEYDEDFAATRDRVLAWLDLPFTGGGEPFHSGKAYSHYYSLSSKIAIREFLVEVASAETWEQLKNYNFLSDEEHAGTLL